MPKNNKETKIAVAMSGGVDSSVAAALLAEKYGNENVFGVTMRLFCYAEKEVGPKNCCSLAAINDAKAVCDKIGIKHYVLDFEQEFEKEVIDNFLSEYLAGRTPNPCIRCNSIIKFDYLLKKAMGLGAEFLATGHYARIIREFPISFKGREKKQDYSSSEIRQLTDEVEKFSIKSNNNSALKLLKGMDEKKDQSYFLYGLTQERLAHTLFPIGEFKKEEVRELARKYGLKTAEKTESQEICFIASDTDYHGFLKKRIDVGRIKEGDIVDKKGNVLGRHKGLPYYTIGQRKGLGVTSKKPLYVVGIDVKENRIVVGDESELYQKECEVKEVNWTSEKPGKKIEAEVAVRYNMKPQKASIYLSSAAKRSREVLEFSIKSNNKVSIVFNESQRAITPGQSAVFYNGEEVLGGGVVDKVF